MLVAAALLAVPAAAETLLVVRKSDDALDFMDPGSGLRVATAALGHAPHEVSVSPDGRRAVVSNYGTREQPGSTLSIVDLEQPREQRRIDLAPHTRPHGVAWFAADRIAVTVEGSQQLLVVEPDTGRIVAAIATGQQVSHMVTVSGDGSRAYVTNIGSGSATAIDLVAGRKLGDVATGGGSEALALTPDGRELWVAARADGQLAIVDTASLAVVERLPLPGVPIRIAMTPDGRTALVTLAGSARTGGLRCRESPGTGAPQGRRAAGARGGAAAVRPPRTGQRTAGRVADCSRRPQRLCGVDHGRSRRAIRRDHARAIKQHPGGGRAGWACRDARRAAGHLSRLYGRPAPPLVASDSHREPAFRSATTARLSRSTIDPSAPWVGPSACPDRPAALV